MTILSSAQGLHLSSPVTRHPPLVTRQVSKKKPSPVSREKAEAGPQISGSQNSVNRVAVSWDESLESEGPPNHLRVCTSA
jgi:hypothetical protein